MCQFAELHSILAAPPDTMEIYDGKKKRMNGSFSYHPLGAPRTQSHLITES
jgi:hypothetical protein